MVGVTASVGRERGLGVHAACIKHGMATHGKKWFGDDACKIKGKCILLSSSSSSAVRILVNLGRGEHWG